MLQQAAESRSRKNTHLEHCLTHQNRAGKGVQYRSKYGLPTGKELLKILGVLSGKRYEILCILQVSLCTSLW